jgi:hypothetical protein
MEQSGGVDVGTQDLTTVGHDLGPESRVNLPPKLSPGCCRRTELVAQIEFTEWTPEGHLKAFKVCRVERRQRGERCAARVLEKR